LVFEAALRPKTGRAVHSEWGELGLWKAGEDAFAVVQMLLTKALSFCPSPDPLGSRGPAQVSVKDGYPPKKWLFYHYWLV